MRAPIGIIHGRFQLLHLDHMKYLLAGKERCDYLLIGISNPDVSLTKFSETCPHRSASASNPLTFYERFQMIQAAMLEAGGSRSEFDIVPFPINYPELLFNYVPRDATFYMTINDAWGTAKLQTLQDLGCDVEVMWEKLGSEKGISGTQVRDRIAHGEMWNHLMPRSVYDYIIAHHLDARIRSLCAAER